MSYNVINCLEQACMRFIMKSAQSTIAVNYFETVWTQRLSAKK
jgi:hypothetical protein